MWALSALSKFDWFFVHNSFSVSEKCIRLAAVSCDMAYNRQLQSSCWLALSRDRSLQDGYAGQCWWTWWQPLKMSQPYNHLTDQIILRPVKPIGNEEECRVSYYEAIFKLNLISILKRLFVCSVHSGSYIFIWLGPLRSVPIAHCAGRGLNLLTAVKPVELAQCFTTLFTQYYVILLGSQTNLSVATHSFGKH